MEIPKTNLGKWSMILNILFLIIISLSIILVIVLKILSFDDHWWGVTVPIAFLISMASLITGIIAVKKYKDNSFFVIFSIIIGIFTIIFLITHSLFISD